MSFWTICPLCGGIGHCDHEDEEEHEEEPIFEPWVEFIETNSVEMSCEENKSMAELTLLWILAPEPQ